MGEWVDSLPGAWRVEPATWATERGWGWVPAGVLRPPNPEAVVEVFRAAQGHPAPPGSVLVAGGGRQLARWVPAAGESGATGGPPVWVVDVSAVPGEVDFNPANLTLEVPAGASWQQVAAVLAREGGGTLDYPIEGPGGTSSTVGGHLAANTARACSYRYGTARDWILGVEFVAADGRRVRAGRPVMKNVAGYDLTKLLIGSRGALGAVLRVILRLRPAPPARQTARLSAGSLERLWPVVLELRRNPGGPVAMEAWSWWVGPTGAAGAGVRSVPGVPAPLEACAPALVALFEYHGPGDELEHERERLEALVAGRAELAWADAGEAQAWWATWRALRLGSQSHGGLVDRLAVARLGVPAGRMPELWQGGMEIAAAGPPCLAMGALGSGVLRVLGPPPDPQRWRRLRELAERLGGYAAWEIAPAGPGYEPTPPPARELSRALARVFDPAGVMWSRG